MLPNPPSTRIRVPVTKLEASSEESQTAAPCNSSGLPNRFIGVCPIIDSILSELSNFYFVLLEKPGIIALTRIPFGANSLAKNCVTLLRPAFDTEYVNTLDNGVVEETEEMLIILPFLFVQSFLAKI